MFDDNALVAVALVHVTIVIVARVNVIVTCCNIVLFDVRQF